MEGRKSQVSSGGDPPRPEDELRRAEDREAAEEAEGAANVGDHVDDGDGGGGDHLQGSLAVNPHADQADLVQEGSGPALDY